MITFSSAYGSIELPNPVLGDNDQFNIGTIFKITMAKAIFSYRQPSPISTFHLTIQNVPSNTAEAFLAWFRGSRGMVHTYTDYNGASFQGIIKNEPAEISIDGRKAVCGEWATITIDFETQR